VRFELGVGRRKKDRKKVTKGYTYSPIWAEALTEAMYIKNRVVSDVLDVITCTKFQNDISGVTILHGVEFSIFLLISEWALQQCSATALHVILIFR